MYPDKTNGRRSRAGEERGSASLELTGAIPIVLLAVLVAAQIAVAGHAFWSAGLAARAGARAVLTGRPPRSAAEHALPGPLRGDLRVSQENGVRVGVRIPQLIPGFPVAHVYGLSSLGES
ncbi:MAG: pilus assembly protein [Thermoleophilia bacterium]|nr:pilus assembly protein [Thermoleophilia bacterium]